MRAMACTACHHEWIGSADTCRWCGAAGKVLSVTKPAPLIEIAAMLLPKSKSDTTH